jgi:aryl-alcohol dehydrogenase-like predicted oxidoreductase
MTTRASRRIFLGAVGGSLALSACRGSKPQNTAAAGAPATPASAAGKPASAGDRPAQAHPKGQVPKRALGRSGEQVSMLGLGGFHIGMQDDEQESIRIIRSAIDAGVTFLDNCWDYNEGKSEIRMGKALRDGYRDKVFLMTKLDGRTRKIAAEQLEQSLKRLQTDRIDLVQMHEIIRAEDPARCFAKDGAMAALFEAKKAGKIRYIGFTGHKDPAYHLAMLKAGFDRDFTFDAVQMPLNVMDPHFKSFEKEVLPVLTKHGIGVLGMKPLGSGEILKAGVVNATECLHYAMNLPTSVVITGCDSMKVLEQALNAARTFEPMPAEQVQALLERTRPHAKKGEYEHFKTKSVFDGTEKNPHWLETAKI